jgi:hypothetical protein
VSGVDLVTFLRARLDEDEREATWAAEEAGGAVWTIRSIDVVLFDDTDRYVSGNAQNEVRDHIARHDPARALREVAVKRRILSDVYEPLRELESAIQDENDTGEDPSINWHEVSDRLLCALAAPFAQHPDFDPAWAVEGTVTT